MSEGNGNGNGNGRALRFDGPVPVRIAGVEVTLEPIKGLKALKKFEEALADEVRQMKDRIETKLLESKEFSPEALLERGADQARLILLGAPGVVTQEMLDEKATAREMLGALAVICELNNLSRFVPFFAPEVLMDLGRTMSQIRKVSPTEPPQPSSSAPASAGGTSSTS